MENIYKEGVRVATRFDFDCTEDEWNNFMIDMHELLEQSKKEHTIPEINTNHSFVCGESVTITLTPECYHK